MAVRTSRSGFTLVELLTVMAIMVIVAAQIAINLGACYRLFFATLAQCELSVRMRELRDRLLFHMRPADAGRVYSGLLGAQDVHIDTVAVNYNDLYVPQPLTFERNGTQTHRLIVWNDGGTGSFLIDDHAPHTADHYRWLHAGGLFLDRGSDRGSDMGSLLEYRNKDRQNRIYLNLSVGPERRTGRFAGASRTERVIVPLFGKEQKYTEELR